MKSLLNTALRKSNFIINETNASNLDGFPAAEIVAIQVCYSIIGSVGLIENICVIMVILCNRIMLDFPSNWFVLSLAIADAGYGLAAILLVIVVNIIHSITLGIVYDIIVEFALLSSTGNLFLLTFNRFLSVPNSLRYPAYMTTNRAKCLVVVPWISAVVIIGLNVYSTQAGINNMSYLVTVLYTILTTLITVLNIYMVKKARDKRKNDVRQEHSFATPQCKSSKRDQRLIINIRLLIVNLTFFGSCIPMMTVLYLYPTNESRATPLFQRKVVWCNLILILNTAINPLVYSFSHPVFKEYFIKLRKMFFIDRSVAPIS